MSIHEGARETTGMVNALNAFDEVNLRFARIQSVRDIRKLSPEEMDSLTRSYLNAGTSYFSDQVDDSYLEEIGETAYRIASQRKLIAEFTTSVKKSLIYHGASSEGVGEIDDSKPFFATIMIAALGNPENMSRVGIVFTTPEFIMKSKHNPIEALSDIAHVLSQIRDFSNGRDDKDPYYTLDRADATEAHFLNRAIKQNPGAVLDSYYKRVMAKYPDSMSNLPEEAEYI